MLLFLAGIVRIVTVDLQLWFERRLVLHEVVILILHLVVLRQSYSSFALLNQWWSFWFLLNLVCWFAGTETMANTTRIGVRAVISIEIFNSWVLNIYSLFLFAKAEFWDLSVDKLSIDFLEGPKSTPVYKNGEKEEEHEEYGLNTIHILDRVW